MEGSPGLNISPFTRSAGSSPAPQTPPSHQNDPSLHYGNRNLSPLFKAARMDPARRPSNLRQELSPASPEHLGGNEWYGGQWSSPQLQDAKASALQYLNTHITSQAKPPLETPTKAKPAIAIASQASPLPQSAIPHPSHHPFGDGATELLSSIYGRGGVSTTSYATRHSIPQHLGSSSITKSGGGTISSDTKSMEDDLKRFLNLSGH